MNGTYRRFAYDGTFEGFLCVAVKCINLRVVPEMIYVSEGTDTGDDMLYVRTDLRIASEMNKFIGNRTSAQMQQMVTDGFLTALPDREKLLISFIAKGIKFGASVADDYDDLAVSRLHAAILDLYREEQSYFVSTEFMKHNNILTASIEPRNYVLPVMKTDIIRKTDYADLMIYDRRHSMVLYKHEETDDIVDIRNLTLQAKNDISRICDELWTYLREGRYCSTPYRFIGHGADRMERMWYVAV